MTKRNDPCPCGSGKKYKRCCSLKRDLRAEVAEAYPQQEAAAPSMPGMPEGFDPSQMDPQMVANMQDAVRRLPKGQMQRLQMLMQKAMSGKDVSKEAAELEKVLPPQMQEMMAAMAGNMPDMAGAADAAAEPAEAGEAGGDMSTDDARNIIEQAVKDGKVSREEADRLLENADGGDESTKKKGFWKSMFGK